MIPSADMKRQYFSLEKEIDMAIKSVNNSGWFIFGKELQKFERNFSDYCIKRHGVGVGNGTDALIIALKSLDIGEGDEVITVPNTAIPTVSAIVETRAKPVFVDIGEDYLMDTNQLEKTITRKTKAVIPVHLYGQSCDMDKILEIARRNEISVIEDCCQAHGAMYKGGKVPIGDIGCFSFYPTKNLGAHGDAGMIITENSKLEEKLRLLRDYGQKSKFKTEIHGTNSRLDEIQAAILNVKLKHLNKWNDKRRETAFFYNSKLKDLLEIPIENKENKHIYHQYVVKTNKRDELQKYLSDNGIKTITHYPIPLHLQKAYEYLRYKQGDFPKAEKYAKEILSLPIFPELRDGEIKEVVKVIKEFF